MEEIDYEHMQTTFEVNLIGQSFLLSGLMNEIKVNSTDIIFIGATIGYKGNEFMPMYSVSKRGMRGLVENCRLALKSSSCRVIGVSPWGMNTPSNIWLEGREVKIAKLTGKNVDTLLDVEKVAWFIYSLTELPKNMEISEVIINRK